MLGTPSDERKKSIDTVRRFARLAEARTDFVTKPMTKQGLPPTMWRVWEGISAVPGVSCGWLQHRLGVPAPYVSRILRLFEAQGLTLTVPDIHDRRVRQVVLTPRGERLRRSLDEDVEAAVSAFLDRLEPGNERSLVAAMITLDRIFNRAEDVPWY